MVGIPRSTGCSICVKRRIKCDEGRPQCENCLKYGAACPGYDKGFKFIAGKPHRAKRQRAGNPVKSKSGSPVDSETRTTSPVSNSSPSPLDSGAWTSRKETNYSSSDFNNGSADISDPVDQSCVQIQSYKRRSDLVVPLPPEISSHKQYQLQLITSLCNHLPNSLPRTRRPQEMQVMTGYLRYLPERFGVSKALDAAVLAFTTQQIGTTFDDMHMVRSGRPSYVQALALLQKSLNSPSEALSSETHATAFLLCTYELFAGTTSYRSWMKHAVGLSKLVQCRGTERYQTEFDIAILRACRGLIIMECMFTGKKVFLTDPVWRDAIREHIAMLPDQAFNNLFENFIDLLAQVPDLLGEGWDLREAYRLGKSSPLSDEQIFGLIWRATELYGHFQEWYRELEKQCQFPLEVPSATNDPVFPVVYDFENHAAGGFYLNFWACMIILQLILQTCGCLPEDAISDAELVNRICKSVEWNAEGTWGGFRLGFPLRIAFEAATSDVKEWIGNWHIKLSRTYAATSLDGLPQDPVVEKLTKQMAGVL